MLAQWQKSKLPAAPAVFLAARGRPLSSSYACEAWQQVPFQGMHKPYLRPLAALWFWPVLKEMRQLFEAVAYRLGWWGERMQRVLEPELMDDEEQAKCYAAADFSEPNGRFMTLFEERFPEFSGGLVLDLGCGPGDIPLRFVRRYRESTVHGLDGSAPMLRYAQNALAHAPDLRTRVRFVQGTLPGAVLPWHQYDAIISNSLLHHLHRPELLWSELVELGAPGAIVCIMDLRRPESEERARAIVEQYSSGEPKLLRRDFFNSLLAAFTVDEVREQLAAAELPLSVEICSDRHLLVWGRLPA